MSEVSKVIGNALNIEDPGSEADSLANKAVQESLSRRLSGLIPSSTDTLAAKYMDMPIKELLAEQKKVEGNIESAKKTLDMIIKREYERYMKEFEKSKYIILSQDDADYKARGYIKSHIIGTYGATELRSVKRLYIKSMTIT